MFVTNYFHLKHLNVVEVVLIIPYIFFFVTVLKLVNFSNSLGSLNVDEESHEGQLPAGTPTAMELQKTFIYFGGVPPNFTTTL